MSHPSLSAIDAQSALEHLQRGQPIDIEPLVISRDGGRGDFDADLEMLRAELCELHEHHGIEANAAFEAEACVLLHSALSPSPAAAADPGFWRWLSLGPLLTIIEARHDPIRPEHIGLGSPWDALLSRLWFRADVAYDDENPDDPYALVRLGDLDFWRSHVLRADYSACRPLIRALVRFQFPRGATGKPRLKPSGDANDGMRALSKRLKLRHAIVAFELLDEADCTQELSVLAEDLN